jgi:hypothetical protein
MNLTNKISLEIKRIYPDIKPYLADRYANKYVSVVLPEIRQAILRPHNKDDELSFNSKEVYSACGQLGSRERLFTLLQQSPHTRLIDIVFRGNIGKLSRVKLNPIYKEQIMYELLEMPTQALTNQERKEIRERANVVIEIDSESLSSFIKHTEQQTKTAGPGKYYDKLINNLLRARELYLEAQEINGKRYLMEYWVTADTGRQYGHYNSLQRMSQEVRHAALGVCHKYDFQAHSFAVMASLAKTIDPDLKIAQIEDYIRYRTAIRQRIATDVGVSEAAIKSVFTSLGFGAKPINNPYTSIRRAVYTEEAYERLINQTEFKFIVEDLQKINDTIDAYIPATDYEWHLNKTYTAKTQQGRKRNRSQKLAWLYQNTEAYITDQAVKIIRERTGLEPLMTVHDCIYYKQPVPSATVIDVQVILRENYPYIRLEHEAIFPIGTDEQFVNRFAQDEQAELEHKQKIHQEELVARGYTNEFMNKSQAHQHKPNPFDKFRSAEHVPDYTEYQYDLEDYR